MGCSSRFKNDLQAKSNNRSAGTSLPGSDCTRSY
jgi:hypothetical protein